MLKFIQRITVFIVGFCLPFFSVTVTVGFSMSLSILSIMLYGISMIPYIGEISRILKTYGGQIFMPLFFCFLMVFINFFNLEADNNTPLFNMSLFSCFTLFLLFLIHKKHDEKALFVCMFGYALGCSLMASMAMQGIGVELDSTTMRYEFFGQNSNITGICLSISSIILIDVILYDKLHIGLFRYILFFLFIPIVPVLVMTGSRTSFLIFGISILTTIVLFPSKTRWKKIILIIFVSALFTYGLSVFIESDSILVERFVELSEEGDLSGRDEIWETLIPYVFDSPFWGYGDTGYVEVGRKTVGLYETKGYLYGYSPHNVILELLLTSGIIGLTIWLFFWKMIIVNAWKSYKEKKEIVSIVLLLPIGACIFSGQILINSYAYLLYAYIISNSKDREEFNIDKRL